MTAGAEAVAAAPRRFGALAHRDFTVLWAGLLVANAGTWMQNVAQGWLIYNLTDDPIALGAMGLAMGVPMVLFPIVGGIAADRIDRLTVLKLTQAVALALTLLLTALTWAGVVQFWHFVAIGLLSATVLAFDNPARQALIPDLVPREDLMSAISLNSISFTGAQMAGPALAGLILAAYPADLFRAGAIVFLVTALSRLAVLLPIYFIAPRHGSIAAPDAGAPRRGAAAEGLAYVRSQPLLLLLIASIAVTSVFGRSFVYLLPIFARDILLVGGQGLGLLNAAAGLGTIVVGLWLAGSGGVQSRRRLIVGGMLGLTASIYVFSFSGSYPLSLVVLALSGAASTLMTASVQTQLQLTVPGALRGRVMSLNTLCLIGLSPLGSFFSASLARLLPIQLALAATASVLALYVGLTHAWPRARRLWNTVP